MNNCSQAPQTTRTRAALESWLRSWNEAGMEWDAWMAEVEAARAAFARLVGASPASVAVMTSVSHATAAVASALDFSGDRRKVVLTEAEFPTVGHVWLAHGRRGAEPDWVPLREGQLHLGDYEARVDRHTLVVSACHGYYRTGFKQDLAPIVELAHARGALVYVDAYQTLGTEPVDVASLDVDFLASGTLKFLMGTAGIAFLYVKPGLADRLEPAFTGWFGRAEPFSFRTDVLDWAPGARRFDGGTPAVASAYVARAGIELIEEVGPEHVRPWTEALSRRLIEGGRERGLELLGTDDPTRKAPTTAFRCPGAHDVESAMRAKGVLASARGDAIRLAPHFYSTLHDVDRALDVLAESIPD